MDRQTQHDDLFYNLSFRSKLSKKAIGYITLVLLKTVPAILAEALFPSFFFFHICTNVFYILYPYSLKGTLMGLYYLSLKKITSF